MVVTYIYHSGYAIEFDDFSILIDFHSDVKRDEKTYWVKDYLLGKQNDLYVLCTHSHPDHFNPEILLWKKEKPNIHYIFSVCFLSHEAIKAWLRLLQDNLQAPKR
jgi:L-ascorbate metabolism protein UlaG (beta-lactamase superfamily)